MSPPRPRRQFGPGTPEEWQRAMETPAVRRALNDPAIASALYKNFRGLGGQVPQAPMRFQAGGFSTQARIAAIDQQLTNSKLDASTRNVLTQERAALVQEQMSPQSTIPGLSASTSAGLGQLAQQGPPTLGNTAAGMGAGALLGLGSTRNPVAGALIGAATAGLLNYAIRKWGKGAKKSDSTEGGGGGGGGGGGNAEPNAVAPSPNVSPGTSNTAAGTPTGPQPGTPAGTSAVEAKFDTGPTTTPNPTPGGANLYMGTANSPSGNVYSHNGQDWFDQQSGQPWSGKVVNQTSVFGGGAAPPISPAATPSFLPTSAPAYMSDMALANAGIGSGITSFGSTAADVAPIANAVASDPALFTGMGLRKGGRVKQFAAGGDVPLPVKKSPRAVLMRKPMGMPVPVLHTTIVIAAKPVKKGRKKKPETKRFGGVEVPRKPNAIPPERGPQDGPVRKHGRVQVPRGFGAAIKGKRFGGIY